MKIVYPLTILKPMDEIFCIKLFNQGTNIFHQKESDCE